MPIKGRNTVLSDRLKRDADVQADIVPTDKPHPVDKLIESDTKINTAEQPKLNDTDTCTGTSPNTGTGTSTVTLTGTSTDTAPPLLSSLLSAPEEFVRCVCYLRKDQANFIKNASKILSDRNNGKRVKESELYRMAVDLLIDAFKDVK